MPRKRPFFAASDFGNLENTQILRVVYRLHQLNMRIFKLYATHPKSRRYVICCIYGFFIYLKYMQYMHFRSARGTKPGKLTQLTPPDSGIASSQISATVRQKTLSTFGVLGFFLFFLLFLLFLPRVFSVIPVRIIPIPQKTVRQCDTCYHQKIQRREIYAGTE